MKGIRIMTQKDLLRIDYMRKLTEKKITQKEVGRLLNLTERHVRRRKRKLLECLNNYAII